MSRDKGHGFEREMAVKFRTIFPKACRQLEYQEGLGVDLVNTGPYRIQCKRFKNYAPLSKIKEAYGEGIPLLVTKADREPTLVALELDDFLSLLEIVHGKENKKEDSPKGDQRSSGKSRKRNDGVGQEDEKVREGSEGICEEGEEEIAPTF